MKVEQRLKKYWIKPGKEVVHKEYPGRKMIVEELIKKNEKILQDGKEVDKQFIIGVECHWFDDSGRYDRGRFLTTELVAFDKPVKESGSFSNRIPTSDVL